MSTEHIPPLSERMQGAVDELAGTIRKHYPDATFRVSRGTDDPEMVHLDATVDVSDTDAVLDVVIDRLVQMQTEEGLPVAVIPTRPLARVLEDFAARKKTRRLPTLPPQLLG